MRPPRSACAVAVALACSLAGCATLLTGKSQPVSLHTDPAGADVTVDGLAYGRTPLAADLRRDADHVIRFSLDGYQPGETSLRRTVGLDWLWNYLPWAAYELYLTLPASPHDGASWGSALAVTVLGGSLGAGVDFLTGAAYRLASRDVAATLAPASLSGTPTATSR